LPSDSLDSVFNPHTSSHGLSGAELTRLPLNALTSNQKSNCNAKTRSGKIMRRILRKIAEDEVGALGDTSTLADPAVIDDLIKNRHSRQAASK
jgi:hypothetical protein